MKEYRVEEFDGKSFVGFVFVHREKRLVRSVLFFELFDSLFYEAENDVDVVAPIDRLLFEQVVELFVILKFVGKDIAPEFFVFAVRRFLFGDIEAVVFAAVDL